MPGEKDNGEPIQGLSAFVMSKVGGFVKKCVGIVTSSIVLWRLWTVPKEAVKALEYSIDERENATLLDLILIVFFLSILRGYQPLQEAVITGGFGLGLGWFINFLSRRMRNWLEQNVFISGYSTFVVMLLMTAGVQKIFYFDFNNLYASLFDWLNSHNAAYLIVIFQIIVGSVLTLALLLAKASIVDKNAVTMDGFTYAIGVTAAAAAGVIVVSLLADDVVEFVIAIFSWTYSTFNP